MSKKIVALILALGMSFSIASCADLFGGAGTSEEASSVASNEEISSVEDTTSEEIPSDSEETSEGNSSSDEGENESTGDSSDSGEEGGNDGENQYVTVTFKQAGKADIVKTVEKGASLTDIPTLETKKGYTVAWDKTDFTNITKDMVVNVVETAKMYTVVCKATEANIPSKTITVTYGQAYKLPAIGVDEEYFIGWTYNGAVLDMEGVWEIDVEGEIILKAKWLPTWTGNY